MRADSRAPIVVRRRKVIAEGGHHGGAWKVAYADFVTAMMAFFLLMWLLNATTERQRKGLADYFSPTVPVSRVSGGGDGQFWGDSLFSEDQLARSGTGGSFVEADTSDISAGPRSGSEGSRLAEAESLLEELHAVGGESMTKLKKLRHVVTRITDEGLVIEISESPDVTLWKGDAAEALPVLSDTLATVAEVLALVANKVAVNAHTSSRPVVLARNPVWELSAARAGAAREALEAAGLDPARLQRVTGFADRKPARRNPMDAANNRLEIIALRSGV